MSLTSKIISSLKLKYPTCTDLSDNVIANQTKAMIDAWCSGITKLQKDNIVIETDYDGNVWFVYTLDPSQNQTQLNTHPIIITKDDSSDFVKKILEYISNGYCHINKLTEDEKKNWYSKQLLTWNHETYYIFN